MRTATELDLQWQATRYAIDLIDENYCIEEDEAVRTQMRAHRESLCALQNDLLNATRQAKAR